MAIVSCAAVILHALVEDPGVGVVRRLGGEKSRKEQQRQRRRSPSPHPEQPPVSRTAAWYHRRPTPERRAINAARESGDRVLAKESECDEKRQAQEMMSSCLEASSVLCP